MTGSKIKTVLRVILVTLLAVIAAGAVFVAYCVVRAPSINVLDAKPHGYRSNVLDRDGNVVSFIQSVKTLFLRSCCVMVLAPSEKFPSVIPL